MELLLFLSILILLWLVENPHGLNLDVNYVSLCYFEVMFNYLIILVSLV